MFTTKRWLILFFTLAVLSVAIFWIGRPVRFIASEGLTDGQRDKVALIESLRLSSTPEAILLETSFLGTVCASASEIELSLAASGVAIDGESPVSKWKFKCGEETAGGELRVSLEELRAAYFPGEKFPEKWFLKGIEVRGESAFGVSEYEIEKVRGSALEIDL